MATSYSEAVECVLSSPSRSEQLIRTIAKSSPQQFAQYMDWDHTSEFEGFQHMWISSVIEAVLDERFSDAIRHIYTYVDSDIVQSNNLMCCTIINLRDRGFNIQFMGAEKHTDILPKYKVAAAELYFAVRRFRMNT